MERHRNRLSGLSARGLFRRSPISTSRVNTEDNRSVNSGENPQTPHSHSQSQLSPHHHHHHHHHHGDPRNSAPIRECACGRGLACQGMSQAFRLLGDPRSYYVELPRYRENPPAYKYVFRNNLRSAYLRHLKKSSPSLKESDFDSAQRRYVALHHFHPTVVKAFHENPLTSAQKHKVPISITEHELRDLNMEINEADRILSVTGVPTGGYYFVPSYPQEFAHRDLKELIRTEREKREAAKKLELSSPPPEEKTETESDDSRGGDGEATSGLTSGVQYKLISAKEYFESRRASVQKELESTTSNEKNEEEPTPEESSLPEQPVEQQPLSKEPSLPEQPVVVQQPLSKESSLPEQPVVVQQPLSKESSLPEQPVVQQPLSKIEKIVDDEDDDTPFADDEDVSTPAYDDKPGDEMPVAVSETTAEEPYKPDAKDVDDDNDTPEDDKVDSEVGVDVDTPADDDVDVDTPADDKPEDDKPADDTLVVGETKVEESGQPEEEEAMVESSKDEDADVHSGDEEDHDYGDSDSDDDRGSTGHAGTKEDDDGGEFDILVADSTASDFDSLWADDSKDDQDIFGPPNTPTTETGQLESSLSNLDKSTPVILESENEDVEEFDKEDVPSTHSKAPATIPARETDHPWETPKYRRHKEKQETSKLRSSGPATFIDPTAATPPSPPSEEPNKETIEAPSESPTEPVEIAESPLHDKVSASEPATSVDPTAVAPTLSEEPKKETVEETPESPAECVEKETIESPQQDEVSTVEPATSVDPTSVAPTPSEEQKKEALEESPAKLVEKEATEPKPEPIEKECPPQGVVASSEPATQVDTTAAMPQPTPSEDRHKETLEEPSESLTKHVEKEPIELKAEPVEKETAESPAQDGVASSEPTASVDTNVATSPPTPVKTEVAEANPLSEDIANSYYNRPSIVGSKDETEEEVKSEGLDELTEPKTADVVEKEITESPSNVERETSSKPLTVINSTDVISPPPTLEQEEKPGRDSEEQKSGSVSVPVEKNVPKSPSKGDRILSSDMAEEEKEEMLSTVPVPPPDLKSKEQVPDPTGKSPVKVKPPKKVPVSPRHTEHISAPLTTGEIELGQPLPGTDPTMRIQVHNELIAWESKRRASLSHEFELNREEWKVAREILRSGVEEVEYAERLVLGFAKAGFIFADSLQAIHDDTLIDDSGNTVSNSFLQNRLQQRRQVQEYSIGKAQAETVGEGESALLNSLIKSQVDLATTLRESSQHMEEFILSEIRDLRATVQSRARDIETVGDGILGELKRSEIEVKNIWDVFDAMVTGDLMEYSTHGSVHGSFHGTSHGGSLHASLGTSSSVHGFSVDNASPIISSLNSPLVKNTFRQLGNVEDGWLIETHYKTAVKYQKSLFDVAAKELESLFTKIISLEEIRFRKLHQVMLAFVPRQERLYTTLPRQMKDVLDNLVGLRIDEESLQAVIDQSIKDRSHNHLKKGQSHRSSIMNRSRIKSVKDSPEDEVQEIENVFGSPFDSSMVLVSNIVELKPGGLGGMVNQNWKYALVVVTSSGSFHIFELSQTVKWAGRTPAEAFKSLYPPRKFDSRNSWIRKDTIVRRLTPTQTLDLTICGLTIPNMRKRQLEIVEERGGQRAHMGARARLLKAVNAGAQRVMRCTLRLSSNTEASEWAALLEKTKKDIRSKRSSQKSSKMFRF